jgi:hypothetical protein
MCDVIPPLLQYCIIIIGKTAFFLTIAFLRKFCQIRSGFHIGFHNNNSLAEQDPQLCVQLPTWRVRSLYSFSSLTIRATYTPRRRGSLFIAFYVTQGYGGGVLYGESHNTSYARCSAGTSFTFFLGSKRLAKSSL